MSNTGFDRYIKAFEKQFNVLLPEKEPIIIRIDGRSFHTYTKGMPKPSEVIRLAMIQAALSVMSDIPGAKVGYLQSDEASFLVKYYNRPESHPFFGNRIQKICSIVASNFTATFNAHAKELGRGNLAQFDCRVFTIPPGAVRSYFLWRQMDCIRNSILSHAQTKFSHKELQNIKCAELAKATNWNEEVQNRYKYGTTIFEYEMSEGKKDFLRTYLRFADKPHFFSQFELDKVPEPTNAL